MNHKTLIVSGNEETSTALSRSLQSAGVEVHHEKSLENAFSTFTREIFTLLIVEWYSNEPDALKILEWLHRQDPIPLIVLSSSATKAQELQALSIGADQYWGTPIDIEIALQRCKALMRRYDRDYEKWNGYSRILSFDCGLKINLQSKSAYLHGERLELRPKQFALLACLGLRAGQLVTKEQLYSEVWKQNYGVNCDETLKYHISKLREAFKTHGADGLVRTFWGVGYGLEA